MKTLKFRHELVSLVLSGNKNSTWRLFDDKDLSEGDDIALKEFGDEASFAEARITKIIEKSFKQLSDNDKRVMKNTRMMMKCTPHTVVITKHK